MQESVFLNIHDGAKICDNLSHEVDGAFEIKAVKKKSTVVDYRGDVVQILTAN